MCSRVIYPTVDLCEVSCDASDGRSKLIGRFRSHSGGQRRIVRAECRRYNALVRHEREHGRSGLRERPHRRPRRFRRRNRPAAKPQREEHVVHRAISLSSESQATERETADPRGAKGREVLRAPETEQRGGEKVARCAKNERRQGKKSIRVDQIPSFSKRFVSLSLRIA